MVQGVSGRRMFLVRFQNGCKNNLSSKSTHCRDNREDPGGGGTFGFLRFLRYRRMQSKKRRDTIDVSMLCYSLKRRSVLTVRRSSGRGG